MLQLTKYIAISVSVSFLSACMFAPGMRVGDLPPSGQVITEKGLNIQVETITAQNIPVTKNETNVQDALPLFEQKTHPIYQLAPGDILAINLWANPEITPPTLTQTTGFTIDQQGYVSFPLIGRVKAAGESLDGFATKLTARLSTYLKQPDAQVTVLAYVGRKFYVDGAVKAPGQFAISNQPQNILSALADAGGALDTADTNNIILTRNGRSYSLNLMDLQNNNLSPSKILLKEGDGVHVYSKENRKLYMLGETGIPSPLVIPDQGMSLANAIGEGRGINPLTSDRTQVYVVRDNAKNNLTNIYHVDLSTITNLALANRFKMQPNDIVYVDASGLARWSRVLNLLLPSAQGVGTLAAAGRN